MRTEPTLLSLLRGQQEPQKGGYQDKSHKDRPFTDAYAPQAHFDRGWRGSATLGDMLSPYICNYPFLAFLQQPVSIWGRFSPVCCPRIWENPFSYKDGECPALDPCLGANLTSTISSTDQV